MSAPRPTVLISPVNPSDYASVAEVYLRSFETTEIMTDIYPPAIQPSMETRIALNVQERTKRYLEPLNDLVEVKATIDGKTVGAAIWLSPLDRTSTGGDSLPHEVEIEQMLAAKEKEAGREPWELEMDKTIDKEFYAKFKKTMKEIRKNWSKGAPHWYLSYLFVDPEYQGCGVGAALMKFGTDQADEAGLPTWLESTIAGRPVYHKKGFEVHSWCEVEGEKFEGGRLRWPGMERKPQAVKQ